MGKRYVCTSLILEEAVIMIIVNKIALATILVHVRSLMINYHFGEISPHGTMMLI